MIFAIIVTYNPIQDKLNSLINALKNQLVTPVIVDNASAELVKADCKMVQLEKNFGIARAQNVGIEYALSFSPDAIIFFDQDSIITDSSFIESLFEPIAKKRAKITAPVFIDNIRGFIYPIVEITKHGGRIKHFPSSGASEFFVNNAISSGTMVETEALRKVGNMVESLFIDYVDTEWCLRAASIGLQVLIVPTVRMTHSIGDRTLKIGRFYVPKHSPFRRYYRIRNSFFLFRLPYVPKLMASREILFAVIHQWILILFSKGERYSYLKSLISGCRDGLLGRFS